MPLALKETDYLKAWGAFILCATVGGFLAGALVGGILGGVLTAAGVELRVMRLTCAIGGFFAGLPVSYAFFRLFTSRMLVGKVMLSVAQPQG